MTKLQLRKQKEIRQKKLKPIILNKFYMIGCQWFDNLKGELIDNSEFDFQLDSGEIVGSDASARTPIASTGLVGED